jgi:hypothetical protein
VPFHFIFEEPGFRLLKHNPKLLGWDAREGRDQCRIFE